MVDKHSNRTHRHPPKQLRQIMFIIPLFHRLIHKPVRRQFSLQASLTLRVQCQVQQRIVYRIRCSLVSCKNEDKGIAEDFVIRERAYGVAFGEGVGGCAGVAEECACGR